MNREHGVIPILDMKPVGQYADGSPVYKFPTCYPSRGVRAAGATMATPKRAHDEGRRIVGLYETADPYGNMGCVLGVVKVEGGYRAVINTYHSNT